MLTLPEKFLQVAEKRPNKKALKYKKGGAYFDYTYAEAAKKIKNIASAFVELGLLPQDRVGILSENRPEWFFVDQGIMLAGGVVVPVHTTFSPRLVVNVLKDAKVKYLFVSKQEQLNKVLLILSELPDLKKIIYLQASYLPEPKERFVSWNNFYELGRNNCELPPVSPQSICSIIYTSGTTGLPKGVSLTHQNFLFDAEAAAQAVGITEHDVFLSFLPLSHVLERTAGCYVPLLVSGATMAFAESFKDLPKNLREVKPTILISVPRVFEKMYDTIWKKVESRGDFFLKIFHWALRQRPDTWRHWLADFLLFAAIRRSLGGRFRFTISGGAALAPRLGKFFKKIGIKICEGYGLTETSPVVCVNPPSLIKIGSVGKVLSGVKVKISSDKEILVAGPSVMNGYWNDPRSTAEAIDEDGWLHTGDLGYLDQEGYLTIIGRKKEMIVTAGGKNIWPEQIENRLNATKYVLQSMVVGDKRKHLTALIVPDWSTLKEFLVENNIRTNERKAVQHPAVQQFYRQQIDQVTEELADYEKIVKFCLVIKEFSQEREELTPTLKLRRSMIATHYQKEIEQMYQA